MTDDCDTHEVLLSILQVLKGIERKLDGYEERLLHLEGSSTEAEQDILDIYINKRDNYASLRGKNKHDEFVAQGEIPPVDGKPRSKIHYSKWNQNHLIEYTSQNATADWEASGGNVDDFLDLRLPQTIEELLGDCWKMPDDDRLPLKFFKSNIPKSRIQMELTRQPLHKIKQTFERDLHSLCRFDQEQRAYKGNDFMVVDFDTFNDSRIYRLGQPAIGPELMVDLKHKHEAPWSRIVYSCVSPLVSSKANRAQSLPRVNYWRQHKLKSKKA